MTKKQMLSILCALTMVGAFGAPAFANDSNGGPPGDELEISDNQLAGDDIIEVEVEDSFTTEYETEIEVEDSFTTENEAEEGSIANMNGTVTSTETETEYDTEIEVEVEDSFKTENNAEEGGIANQSGCVTKTETEVEVELSAEEGGMLLAGKGSQQKTEIEDSYNDNREWDFEMEIEDSYNTDNSVDNSVELEAELVQIATGPSYPNTVRLASAENENGGRLLPAEIAKNELELCNSFNGWTGINNNVQTVGRHLNGGNLNAIAVGQGFNR